MDGPRCSTLIRELFADPANASSLRPRICCVTAYDSAQVKERALAAGMDAFFTKPIFKEESMDLKDTTKKQIAYPLIKRLFSFFFGLIPNFRDMISKIQ